MDIYLPARVTRPIAAVKVAKKSGILTIIETLFLGGSMSKSMYKYANGITGFRKIQKIKQRFFMGRERDRIVLAINAGIWRCSSGK